MHSAVGASGRVSWVRRIWNSKLDAADDALSPGVEGWREEMRTLGRRRTSTYPVGTFTCLVCHGPCFIAVSGYERYLPT